MVEAVSPLGYPGLPVTIGGLVTLRVNDGTNNYLYVAADGSLMAGCLTALDQPQAWFTIVIKHSNGCGSNGCVGQTVSSVTESNSLKIMSFSASNMCGASLGGAVNCKNPGSWSGYELIVSG